MSSKSRTGFGRELDFPPNTTHPIWSPYRGLLGRLAPGRFPDAADLTALLPPRVTSAGGASICFVAAGSLPGADYEREIYETGRVSTRERSRHDLFNALVWCRLPRLKAALNELHYRHLDDAHDGRRGAVRDALTLLDECGALVLSHDRALLEHLAARDWSAAFYGCRRAWSKGSRVLVCGHAVLEKFENPFKSVTAHAVLFHATDPSALNGPGWIAGIDRLLARQLSDGDLLRSTADLSPLPLAGIPGWWPGAGEVDFYRDRGVFRAPPDAFAPSCVHATS